MQIGFFLDKLERGVLYCIHHTADSRQAQAQDVCGGACHIQPKRDMISHPGDLAPIEHRTLSDMVTARIRDAIIEGTLKPGQRLTEPMLARRLDVSRSPIREALGRLRNQGLVVGSAASYVWNPTPMDIDEILSLRTTLDCLADEWAIHKHGLSQEDFDRLQAMIDHFRDRLEDADELNSTEVVDADETFQETIYRQTGHSRLIRLWQQLLSQRRAVLYRHLESCDLAAFAAEVVNCQQIVLDGLRRGDLKAVHQQRRSFSEDHARQIKATLRAPEHATEIGAYGG